MPLLCLLGGLGPITVRQGCGVEFLLFVFQADTVPLFQCLGGVRNIRNIFVGKGLTVVDEA